MAATSEISKMVELLHQFAENGLAPAAQQISAAMSSVGALYRFFVPLGERSTMSCGSVETPWSRHSQRIISGKTVCNIFWPWPLHAPCVVHVVAFFGEGLLHPDVLVEPVASLVVTPIRAATRDCRCARRPGTPSGASSRFCG